MVAIICKHNFDFSETILRSFVDQPFIGIKP